MFADGSRTNLSDPHDEVAATLSQVQAELYDDVTDRGWFRAHPAKARSGWATRGTFVLLAGVVGTFVLARYLPFAIAFGIAERWSRVVAEAAAAGRPVPEPSWYVGPTAFWAAGGLGQDVMRFTGAADSAMAPMTAGASGAGGFSGGTAGGGVSGGGGTW